MDYVEMIEMNDIDFKWIWFISLYFGFRWES